MESLAHRWGGDNRETQDQPLPPRQSITHMRGDLLQLPQGHLVVRGADISPEVIVL